MSTALETTSHSVLPSSSNLKGSDDSSTSSDWIVCLLVVYSKPSLANFKSGGWYHQVSSSVLVSDCITLTLNHNMTLSGHFLSLREKRLPHKVTYQSFIILFFWKARKDTFKMIINFQIFDKSIVKNKVICVQRRWSSRLTFYILILPLYNDFLWNLGQII